MKAFIALSCFVAMALADGSGGHAHAHAHAPVHAHAPLAGPIAVAPILPIQVNPAVIHSAPGIPVAHRPAPYRPAPAPYRPAPAPYHPAPAYAPAPAYSQAPAYGAAPAYHDTPPVYEFGYGVQGDAYHGGANFAHNENRNGYSTKGEYRVELPDGRTQIVTYSVGDAHSGYVADVKYIGNPVPVRPAYGAPAYAPAPLPAYGPAQLPAYGPAPVRRYGLAPNPIAVPVAPIPVPVSA